MRKATDPVSGGASFTDLRMANWKSSMRHTGPSTRSTALISLSSTTRQLRNIPAGCGGQRWRGDDRAPRLQAHYLEQAIQLLATDHDPPRPKWQRRGGAARQCAIRGRARGRRHPQTVEQFNFHILLRSPTGI